ncbi:MAG: hypothetical protein KF774_08155 [Planctomyces sp.]|nr:hypothetical protein [Planctomyces sp.]
MLQSEFRDASRPAAPSRLQDFFRQTQWPTLISGIAIGLASMQLLVARTVTTRVDQLSRDVAQMRGQVVELAGSANDARRTNDLLAELADQRQRLQAASQTVADLRRIQTQLEQEGARLSASANVVKGLRQLQAEVIAQQPQLDAATRSVAASAALQNRMSEMAQRLPAQAAGIAEAEAVVAQLAGLKEHALEHRDGVEAAREQVDALNTLVNGLNQGGERLIQARVAAGELVAIKNVLAIEMDGIERSQNAAGQLLALNETLSGARQISIDEAQSNLRSMLQVQEQLSGQTRLIAESVENLDLLADFQTVLNEQLTNLDGLRRQLTDLVMMEAAMARAAKTLAPLAEIGSMRGLNEHEVREAARAILDRRTSRSTTTRLADGSEPEVISISSPDEVFEPAARPAPVPPTE